MSTEREPLTFQIQAPDLSEVNESMRKLFANLQGLRMYSEAEIREIKAQAWDEGEQAGAMNHAAKEYPELPVVTNPYRGSGARPSES